MTETISIRPTEHGVVRVFHLGADLASGLDPADGATGLAPALGVAKLATADVQIVDLKAIKEIGLTDFLKMGYDIEAAEIDQGRARLDATEGTVAVVRSAAFGGQGAEVTLRDDVRLLGTYHEQSAAPASFSELNDLKSKSAEGHLSPSDRDPPTPDPRSRTYMVWMMWAIGLVGALLILRLIFWT